MKIEVTQDRSLFAAHGGSQRYVRLTMDAPRERLGARQPLSLALVLDRSGSMAGPKFELARKAALECLRLLQPTDYVSVVVYDTDVQTLVAAAPATTPTLANLEATLCSLDTGETTNLEGGWLEGAAAAGGAPVPRMRLLLLTDGLANVGETHPIALCRHARELRERGLFTTTIGIGTDFDELLLRQIAEAGGGNFHYVDMPEQFEAILSGEVGEAIEPYAEDISVHVDVAPTALCRVLGERTAHPTASGVIARVGLLAAGHTTDVVLRVDPPAMRPGDECTARLAVQWTSARDGRRHVESPRVVTFRAADTAANRAQARHAGTVERVVALRVADVLQRALTLNRDAAYEQASALVREERRELRHLAAGNPAALRLVEALREREHEVAAFMDAGVRLESVRESYNTQRMRQSYRRPVQAT